MSLITRLGLLVAISVLPLAVAAQVVTDTGRATAARDSVVQHAAATRQLLEAQTTNFSVKARRIGKRRIVTQGFASRRQNDKIVMGDQTLLWKKVVVHRRSGMVVETFRGYLDKESVLKETRHDGQLTYLLVQSFKPVQYKSTPALAKRSQLTGAGYVLWNNTMFLVPRSRGI